MEKQIKLVYKESGISITNRTILEALNIIQSIRTKYGDDAILEQYEDYENDSAYRKYYVIEKRLETDEELKHRVEINDMWQRSEYERLKKIYG